MKRLNFSAKYGFLALLSVLLIAGFYSSYGYRAFLTNADSRMHEIPILMYHHISENPKLWSEATISPEKFREDLLYLKTLGYNTIHFKDYVAYQENGAPLPENPIIITFDDGYLSNYEYAFPILQELDMKATIAVIGWCRGRSHKLDGVTKIIDHFSWQQALEMYNSGLIDIQHHTYDLHHPGDDITTGKGVGKMTHETLEDYQNRFLQDTLKLKELIEAEIGNEVNVFVYPFGVYNQTTETSLKEHGFKVSLTTKEGISNLSKGLTELKRINMPAGISSPDLMKKITKLQKRRVDIPFADEMDQEKRIQQLENLLGIKK